MYFLFNNISLKRPNCTCTNAIIDNNDTRTDVSGVANTFKNTVQPWH